jgi:hypothetical protein
MMLQHHGRTYRVSANVEKGLYLHTDAEIISKSDCVLTPSGRHGEPISTNHPIQPIGLAFCGRPSHALFKESLCNLMSD